MSKEQNAAALTKFAEAVSTGNYDLFDDVVAPNSIDHDPAPGQVPGPKGYRALFTEMRRAFPDMKVEVAELVADEDAIAFAYTFTGTQNGPLMAIPATGKQGEDPWYPDLEVRRRKDHRKLPQLGSAWHPRSLA